MAVEIKELIIRALVGRDEDDEQEKTEQDQRMAQKGMQASISQDAIATVTDMLNKQKER